MLQVIFFLMMLADPDQAPPVIIEQAPPVQLAQAPPIVQQPPVAPPSNAASAKIRVTVAEDALIWFDGVLTTSTGADREFVTPPITRQGTYKLKLRHGTRETIRDVTVRPGDDITIDLRSGSPRVTGTRSGETTGGISTERPPFSAPSSGAAPPPTADGDFSAAGPWPRGFPRPAGLFRYPRARFTQQSFNRSGNGINTVVRRESLEEKWQVPGGLAGITGWNSTLYRGSNDVRNWFGHVDPNDDPRVGVWGSEITHQRSYGDGAVFADVLSNTDGRVFEVRYAEKIGGDWHRYIAYKNAAERPHGYVPPTSRQCVECHAQAGTGGYGVGLIPGGDTVISEPFEALE